MISKYQGRQKTSELAYQLEMWVYYRIVINCDSFVSTRNEVNISLFVNIKLYTTKPKIVVEE